jgi:hypothetical protein
VGGGCTWDPDTNTLSCGSTGVAGCVSQGTQGCIRPPCMTLGSNCGDSGYSGPPNGGGGEAPAQQQAAATPSQSTVMVPGMPADSGANTPFVPQNPDAYSRCINGLLAQAVARGVGSFFAPPSDPAWTDLASVVKEGAQNPALKVATVYAVGKVAQRFLTKQVASKLAARVGSEFIPVIGQAAAAYMIGDAAWQGFSWYKSQVENGACQAY